MTEDEWKVWERPGSMFYALREHGSERKLRLFACACCRDAWQGLREFEQDAVVVAEQFADGETGEPARRNAWRLRTGLSAGVLFPPTYSREEMIAYVGHTVGLCSSRMDNRADERTAKQLDKYHADLLRDIFGNPFRPIMIDPRWLTANVVDLAAAAYKDRAFDRLPILADALMDAGCDDEGILAHCRSEGPHVRGCWVVDLLLGKS